MSVLSPDLEADIGFDIVLQRNVLVQPSETFSPAAMRARGAGSTAIGIIAKGGPCVHARGGCSGGDVRP